MSRFSRLRLLEDTWFSRCTAIGPLVLGPVTLASYLLMERIGHPLLSESPTVEVTPENLLAYAWIHTAGWEQINQAMLAPDPAAHVAAQAAPLAARLAPHHLDLLEEGLLQATLELAAAAARVIDEGKPPAGPAEPAPTSSPSSPMLSACPPTGLPMNN